METNIPTYRYGDHVSFSSKDGLAPIVSLCIARGYRCCQLFLGNPKTPNRRHKLLAKDSQLVRDLCLATGFKVYTHFPYTMKLIEPHTPSSLSALQSELDTLAPFGGRIVIHPGSGKCSCTVDNPSYRSCSTKACEYNQQSERLGVVLRDNLLQLRFDSQDFPLLLEPPAGEGFYFGWSFEHYDIMTRAVKGLPVGLCIDTCHTFAAGLCRFDTREAVVAFFDKLEAMGTLPLVKAIHFNDSDRPFASYVDRHAPIGGGYIWSDSSALIGMATLFEYCYRYGIDAICEVADPLDSEFAHGLFERAKARGICQITS